MAGTVAAAPARVGQRPACTVRCRLHRFRQAMATVGRVRLRPPGPRTGLRRRIPGPGPLLAGNALTTGGRSRTSRIPPRHVRGPVVMSRFESAPGPRRMPRGIGLATLATRSPFCPAGNRGSRPCRSESASRFGDGPPATDRCPGERERTWSHRGGSNRCSRASGYVAFPSDHRPRPRSRSPGDQALKNAERSYPATVMVVGGSGIG